MKMKSATFGPITIVAWDKRKYTVTLIDGRKSTCKIRNHESGAPEKSYILHKNKRCFLYQFDADCGGTFWHHFLYDKD